MPPSFAGMHLRAWKEGNPLKTTRVSVTTWRPLRKGEAKTIYLAIKKAFGRQDKKSLTEKNQRLYDLVQRLGGPPQKNKRAFWLGIMHEWNRRYGRKYRKYRTPNGPRVAYRRIVDQAG
jgi:hypothetical protein